MTITVSRVVGAFSLAFLMLVQLADAQVSENTEEGAWQERISSSRAQLAPLSGFSHARESALVDLARAIDQYLDHNPESSDGTALRREALRAYVDAADIALASGRIRYTREIAALAFDLKDRDTLDEQFTAFLANSSDEKGLYLARVDYAHALTNFGDPGAKALLAQAVAMREPKDGIEAHLTYARYLEEHGLPDEALALLEPFRATDPLANGIVYVDAMLQRQRLIHALGRDSMAVDQEIAEMRKALKGSIGIGPIPKRFVKDPVASTNSLGLKKAGAFSHNNSSDDSRGPNGNNWITLPGGTTYSRMVVNGAEVMYNEARGESLDGRAAVAWSIRNRALIDMNGCDFYPGAEGHGTVTVCRLATPIGPQPWYAWWNQRYSCVIHGGTTSVGASHFQMNDAHVSGATLEATGFMDEFFATINGWVDDETSASTPSGTFSPDLDPPFFVNLADGNPAGAQEWRSINYCAANHSCKQRLGNVGGNLADPGNPCPSSGGLTTDNFFWGRKP